MIIIRIYIGGTHKENMEQMSRDGGSTRNKSIIRNISKSRITLVKRKDYQKVSFDIYPQRN